MKLSSAAVLLLSVVTSSTIKAEDMFHYGEENDGTTYGVEDWDRVDCDDIDTCPGWPNKLEGSIGWKIEDSDNYCRWCPETGNDCGQHRQSPIDLIRDRAIADHPNWKECPDWHWMQFYDGTCTWDDMEGQFEITREALRLHTPLKSNGDIDCVNEEGERKFPKLDYSKGFPDWWHLSRTDIKVPSEHVQHGQRYAAEVHLSHFYELEHYRNHLGIIAIFMQDYEGEPAWPYLDKLICQWRKEEQKVRTECGLDPAPVYKMCELYGDQVRSAKDLDFPVADVGTPYPSRAPLVPPPSIPVINRGSDPDTTIKLLELCEGDCDSTLDCAEGLICHRRDAFGAVPGCLGGETDDSNTDYCIFDTYGDGYSFPTEPPTNSPSVTPQPSMTPPKAIPVIDFGGSPPLEKFPLQICQGDCDNDEHCAEGLICFQRDSNVTVPGCIGGDKDIQKTDYCIFDPYGAGYTRPETDAPTTLATTSSAPTVVPAPSLSPTYYPRPTGPLRNVTQMGWEPKNLPLGECEGDCDNDDDCGPGLYCHERYEIRSPVPGCAGGDTDESLMDFCAYRPIPTDSEPAVPSPAPTGVGRVASDDNTTTPVVTDPKPEGKPAVLVSWTPNSPLGECEGDCDNNADCATGLKCLQRNNVTDSIPGCNTADLGESQGDFCIVDPDFSARADTSSPTGSPSLSPVDSPTNSPVVSITVGDVPSSSPVVSIDVGATNPSSTEEASDGETLVNRGWTPPAQYTPLSVCEGDCDTNDDCKPGLKCFQRYSPNEAVPGCKGGEDDGSLTDYCIVDDAAATTAVPGPAPTDEPITAGPAPTDEPVASPTSPPQAAPVDPTQEPVATSTDAPSNSPVTASPIDSDTAVPATSSPSSSAGTPGSSTPVVPIPVSSNIAVGDDFDCDAWPDVKFYRMCKEEACCDPVRSSTQFCHENYATLGDDIVPACHHCCFKERGVHKAVGPPAEPRDDIPQTIACEDLRAVRMCREDSCCTEQGSQSNYCQQQQALFPGQANLASICWYCCFPSIEVDFPVRKLEEIEDRPLSENDKVTHMKDGRKVIVREENFTPKDEVDEEEYFQEIFDRHLRNLQTTNNDENYDQVYWWPYEFLLKVRTEYYFRYEGGDTVPPCYERAMWRVLKDPIRVAPHQMRELERLIAWRRNPDSCDGDTAGVPREGSDGNAVDVNRPVQGFHTLHRKVFCECQDWPSKFPEDRQWCRNWKTRDPMQRLFEQPYNWRSEGFEV